MEDGYIRLMKQGRDIRSLGIRKKGWQAVYGEQQYAKGRLNKSMLQRCHRIAETGAMLRQAGIQVFPEAKPEWQTFVDGQPLGKEPVFWSSREIKTTLDAQQNFNSSRFAGVLAGARPYVVYNSGCGHMVWHDCSEAHTRALISRMVRAPTDDAIVLGQRMDHILEILNTNTNNTRSYLRVDTCFPNLYYTPLIPDSAQMLHGLTLPHWRKRLVDSLLTQEEQDGRLNSMECDGLKCIDGRLMPVLVACECNLPKLYRLKLSLMLKGIEQAAVYCLPFQKNVYAEYFGKQVLLLTTQWS